MRGPADSFSSYPYENRLKSIKYTLRSGYKPLKQIANRDLEREETTVILDEADNHVTLASRHYIEDEIVDGAHFKYFRMDNVVFKCNGKDSCFRTVHGEVAVLSNIVLSRDHEVFFIGYCFRDIVNLYEYPFPSSDVGIVQVSELVNVKRAFPLHEVHSKCWLMPDGDNCACFPLLHSLLPLQ